MRLDVPPEWCEKILGDRDLRRQTLKCADDIRSGIAVTANDAALTIGVMDYLKRLPWHRRLALWLRSRKA